MKKVFITLFICIALLASAKKVVEISPSGADDTRNIQQSINSLNKKNAELRFLPGEYLLSRTEAFDTLLYVSNTTSPKENPDPTKHIAMLFRDLKGLRINAEGARFVTRGEVTPWAFLNCENITWRGGSFMAEDPTVAEMTVVSADSTSFVARPEETSKFISRDSTIVATGHGWEAPLPQSWVQIFDSYTQVNKRLSTAPFKSNTNYIDDKGLVHYSLVKPVELLPGQVLQFRHGIRNEVGGFIDLCNNITLEGITWNFLGNFGIVAQNSENINYERLTFEPSEGRVTAGFADFLQLSGCRGHINIKDCVFDGPQDDPINIHGTAMKVISAADSALTLEYGHAQTYGFPIYFAGDSVEIVDAQTLLPTAKARVISASMNGPMGMNLTLDRPVIIPTKAVVENISACPSAHISGCIFRHIPTRGILVTTRSEVVIEDNTFYSTVMPAILIADDASSWYESGPVKDITIRNNFFHQGGKSIVVAPEIKRFAAPVHSGIKIYGNLATSPTEIDIRGAEDLFISHNYGPIDVKLDETSCR